MNHTIIRKADDELIIEELKEENRNLQLSCERLLNSKKRDN